MLIKCLGLSQLNLGLFSCVEHSNSFPYFFQTLLQCYHNCIAWNIIIQKIQGVWYLKKKIGSNGIRAYIIRESTKTDSSIRLLLAIILHENTRTELKWLSPYIKQSNMLHLRSQGNTSKEFYVCTKLGWGNLNLKLLLTSCIHFSYGSIFINW